MLELSDILARSNNFYLLIGNNKSRDLKMDFDIGVAIKIWVILLCLCLWVGASDSELELSSSGSSNLFLDSLLFVSGGGPEGGPEGVSSSILSSSKVCSKDEISLEEEKKEVVLESDCSLLSFSSRGLGC